MLADTALIFEWIANCDERYEALALLAGGGHYIT
jgi:hypothetical protein